MKQVKWTVGAVFCMIIAMNVACNHNVYDVEKHQAAVDSVSPVDSVDAKHTWILAKTKTLIAQIPNTGDYQWLRILTANPRETGDAKVVSEAWVSPGAKITMSVSYSNMTSELYAALVDKEGYYTIMAFNPDIQSSLSFTGSLLVENEKLSYEPQPQQFTYCFEDEFPAPGDYDYNDVVMRVSKMRTGEKELRLTVQLAAVGSNKQIAGAIRLIGFNYGNIESVKTVDSLSFNTTNGKDFPDQMMTVHKEKDFLLEGRHQEAVINLFCDAHWATGDLLEADYGMMDRKKYNVSKGAGKDYQQFVPRSVTYIIKFKSGDALNLISMDAIDPFILEMYNGGVFEVHQYPYREAQTLKEYPTSPIKNLPWAFCIPSDNFRWPLEGVNIGFIMKESHVFGAYQTYGHSFGEWAMDRTRAIDWFYYPTENQVF